MEFFMDPVVECPYCGLNLSELPDHDLFSCKMQAKSRAESQVKALERLYELQDLRRRRRNEDAPERRAVVRQGFL